jgi:tRNA A37 threonylcarbamoyladenosine biosynthesis protein TsaE
MTPPQIVMYEHNPAEGFYREKQIVNVGDAKEPTIFKMEIYAFCEGQEKVIDIVDKTGAKKTADSRLKSLGMEDLNEYHTWTNPDSVIYLSYHEDDKTFNLEASSYSKSFLTKLFEDVVAISSKRPPSSNIMVLVTGQRGLRLNSIGETNCPLTEANYSPEILLQYRHLKECLGTNDPCGRLVLLSGPPGTGKSYMIRGITSEVEAMFILVPTSIAGEITGPSFLPVLMDNKDDDLPIVLLIEDADLYLAKKARDTNPSGISDLLNLGDGLFGEMADIRIIATSNADKLTIDDAILRPGRMCSHLEMMGLMPKEAEICYKTLTGKDFVGKWDLRGTPLSDIYKMARNEGWKPEPAEEIRAGTYL